MNRIRFPRDYIPLISVEDVPSDHICDDPDYIANCRRAEHIDEETGIPREIAD